MYEYNKSICAVAGGPAPAPLNVNGVSALNQVSAHLQCIIIYTFSMGAAVSRVVWCIVLSWCSLAVCHCIDVTILIHACMQQTSIHSILVNTANGVEMRQQQRRGRGRPIAHKWRSVGSSFITWKSTGDVFNNPKLVNFIIIVFEMWSPRWWSKYHIKIAKMCSDGV